MKNGHYKFKLDFFDFMCKGDHPTPVFLVIDRNVFEMKEKN